MDSGGSMERRSRDKQKEVAATMSSEEDDSRVLKDQDDVRQYRCFKKYEEIVKQVYHRFNTCNFDNIIIFMLHDFH